MLEAQTVKTLDFYLRKVTGKLFLVEIFEDISRCVIYVIPESTEWNAEIGVLWFLDRIFSNRLNVDVSERSFTYDKMCTSV